MLAIVDTIMLSFCLINFHNAGRRKLNSVIVYDLRFRYLYSHYLHKLKWMLERNSSEVTLFLNDTLVHFCVLFWQLFKCT